MKPIILRKEKQAVNQRNNSMEEAKTENNKKNKLRKKTKMMMTTMAEDYLNLLFRTYKAGSREKDLYLQILMFFDLIKILF
jgi:hypothetical protein